MTRALVLATRRRKASDRALVADARALKRCLATHGAEPSACAGARHALQLAGHDLRLAERELSHVAAATAATQRKPTEKSPPSSPARRDLQAPSLTVSGQS